MGFFSRLKDSLNKTRRGLVEKIEGIISSRKAIDETLFEELEEALIEADVGGDTALELIEALREEVKRKKVVDPNQLRSLLKEQIRAMLDDGTVCSNEDGSLRVIMVVGVNGTGKTTTIGKLAHYYKSRGQKVVLGAADTFRAAAIDQLEIWGRRVGADVIKHREGADPAAVAYDSLQAAKARGAGVLIIDTAGRLHTKKNLMEELKKIKRVLERELPGAPHEVLLVLDATTGQNAVVQAEIFKDAVGVTGVVLTKLDGTAKGGVIVAVKKLLGVPVRYIGIGEDVEDLRPFDAAEFVEALFATEA